MALPDLWFCILYTVFRHHDWATDHLRCSLCASPCSSDVSFGPLAWPVPRARLYLFACSGSGSPASRGRGGRRRSQRRRRSRPGRLAGSQERGSTRPGKFTGEGGEKAGPTSKEPGLQAGPQQVDQAVGTGSVVRQGLSRGGHGGRPGPE